MHKNILGLFPGEITPIPIPVSPIIQNYAEHVMQADPLMVGEYTINPSLQLFTDDDFEKMVRTGKISAHHYKEFRGLKMGQVIESIEIVYPKRDIAGIEFCRWLLEESVRAPLITRDKLPHYSDHDVWFYFLSTLVRQLSGEWYVLAIRLGCHGYEPEVMNLDGFWKPNDRVILYRD